ncbi:hypothetical protein CEXT_186121 [Caerostris extrusa]|uniref:Uncharacterized protein n=1 Tax=Caerostris extrusa TaxID=172846 RepID=A0AAV4TR71_CAEEX|nr:hypothetical protein CEXT_186121 [Caerostris extrusa]
MGRAKLPADEADRSLKSSSPLGKNKTSCEDDDPELERGPDHEILPHKLTGMVMMMDIQCGIANSTCPVDVGGCEPWTLGSLQELHNHNESGKKLDPNGVLNGNCFRLSYSLIRGRRHILNAGYTAGSASSMLQRNLNEPRRYLVRSVV